MRFPVSVETLKRPAFSLAVEDVSADEAPCRTREKTSGTKGRCF